MRHTVCRALQKSTNAHDSSSNENGLLSSKIVAKDESSNGAKETANVVDGGDCGHHGRVVPYVEGVQEVIRYDDSAKHTLIVTKLCKTVGQQDEQIGCIEMFRTRVMSVAHATVTQNVSHPPRNPKYLFSPFSIVSLAQ